jgi:nucleoside-diphosphate-sugar epimerase
MTPKAQARAALLETALATVLPQLDLRALDGKRLFLTGGTGFFGLWLLSALRALHGQGLKVQVCVLSRDPGAFLVRHPQFAQVSWLRWVPGNVRELEPVHGDFDLLLHAATETSLAAHADAARMFDDIVRGTQRVLTLAERSGVRRVLLIGSGAVYGPQPPGQVHQSEDSALACNPLLPASAYGEGKRVMELLGAISQQASGIEVVNARCYAFSGAGLPLDGHFAIGNFVRDALTRECITVQGDGLPMRSYLDGADLAVWLLGLLLHGQAGQAYHVGSDEALSIHALAQRVRDVLAPGKPVQLMGCADPAAAVRPCYVPSIVRARALGYAPWTGLDESLRRMASFAECSN